MIKALTIKFLAEVLRHNNIWLIVESKMEDGEWKRLTLKDSVKCAKDAEWTRLTLEDTIKCIEAGYTITLKTNDEGYKVWVEMIDPARTVKLKTTVNWDSIDYDKV